MEHHAMRPDRPRLGSVRTLVGSLVAALAGLLVALAPTTHAYAEPTVAELEAQIDTKWHVLEPFVEQYNAAQIKLDDAKGKAAKLQVQIQPLQDQIDVARARVTVISVQAYKYGQQGTVNALLASDSATALLDKLGTLDSIASGEQETVSEAARIKAEFDKQKQPLDALVATISAQQAKLTEQAKSIRAEIDSLNQLRQKAFGNTSGGGERPVSCPVTYDGSPGAKAAQYACGLIGVPYVWAAESRSGVDCSGLVKLAWAQEGVYLPHNTVAMWDATRHVTRAQLQPGDSVHYYSGNSHMAMYVGGGWIVEAPQPGSTVTMSKIDNYPIYGYARPGA